LRDALRKIGIDMPLEVLRDASADEKAALAEIVAQRLKPARPR